MSLNTISNASNLSAVDTPCIMVSMDRLTERRARRVVQSWTCHIGVRGLPVVKSSWMDWTMDMRRRDEHDAL